VVKHVKLCLNAIVRNESARIERLLASVANHIAYWVISDTGSTDGTQQIIHRFFAERHIPGILFQDEFVDFSTSRNRALDIPVPNNIDYYLLADADMELVVEDPGWAAQLIEQAYRMVQKAGGISYANIRLLRRDVRARYVGVTHEYLAVEGPETPLSGAYWLDHADGSNRENKFARDAALLEAELKKEPNDIRSVFYLAQTYSDMGRKAEAAELYRRRADMGGWEEERWYALLAHARCRHAAGLSWISETLAAYQARPTRAEPLYDLAKYYREQGDNAASLVFSTAALSLHQPDDALFVEEYIYRWGIYEEAAITGFYGMSTQRELGRECSEYLALSREVPEFQRQQAWRNLFFYTRPLCEEAPSFAATRLDFTPPDGYHPLNPSICQFGGKMVLNMRTVNYIIGADGRYVMPPDNVVRTRNFLFRVNDDLTLVRPVELRLPTNLPEPVFNQCLGFEDVRLFPVDAARICRVDRDVLAERDRDDPSGELRCSATTRQIDPEGWCDIVTCRIRADGQMTDWSVIRPPGDRRIEKNWLPIISTDMRWLYSCDPVRIIDLSGDFVVENISPVVATDWNGSSQLIPFDGGYLCLVHERQAYPDPMRGQRDYQRRFVWFDSEFRIRRFSQRFRFGDGEGEFCCGMCWHPDGRRLVISYGVLDREAWLATVDAEEVCHMLQEPPGRPVSAVPAAGRSVVPVSAFPTQAASVEPPRPDPVRQRFVSWVQGQTNKPLRTAADVEFAASALTLLDLPLHPDRVKAWDTFLAIYYAGIRCAADAPVLDAGVADQSVFLPGLYRLGFTDLLGVNLDEGVLPVAQNGIRYQRGDITASGLPTDHFAFVACLSVIEHGVDWRKFLVEMRRILQPGGHLFVSFDYWQDPVETHGRMAFGAPIKIFTRSDIDRMVGFAEALGLEPTVPVELDCSERVVNWTGMDFTFMSLLLQKK
jgi:glycosyltransferase involved in cell wall biosynthesis